MEKQKGVVALAITIIILLIASAIIFAFVLVFLNRIEATRNIIRSEQAYYAAESGAEDALLRLLDSGKQQAASPYSISLGNISTTINRTTSAGTTEIKTEGSRGDMTRKLKIVLTRDTTAFNYGLHTGQGGLLMENNSTIFGSAYSNNGIQGNNTPTITGDAFASLTNSITGMEIQGNARAFSIVDSEIFGDAHADNLADCEVGGNAHYNSSIDCDVDGTTTQEAYEQLEEEPMPVGDEEIDEWKQEAEAGGITTCNNGTSHILDSSTSIGPTKIPCDLEISGNSTITIQGYIWVEGNIIIQNQPTVELDSSFGDLSSAIIADNPADRENSGIITIQNNPAIQGSGHEDSFLMLASMNSSCENGNSVVALNIGNGSQSSIYYGPHGCMEISNNVDLSEATAYSIHLSNGASITYEQGLQNVLFSSGPAAKGYVIMTWEEE